MSGKFIALILAASVAATGMTAAPARAADRDLALALGALVGVAILGAAIQDAKKDKRYVAPQRHARPKYGAHHHHRKAHKAHKGKKRNSRVDRAYRQGYNDHRGVVRDRRAERHIQRRDRHPQYGYSARPYRYGN
ncbi:MAG TPA: hypothetical protein VIN05_06075 [Roseovarius sp.]